MQAEVEQEDSSPESKTHGRAGPGSSYEQEARRYDCSTIAMQYPRVQKG